VKKFQILQYYSRPDIMKELVRNASGREVAGAFIEGNYDSRPNIIQYPDDVVQMVKKGVTSFHFSVERWSSPMALTPDNYDKLRIGWDFILDIDSKIGIEGSQLAAAMICDLLGKYGIKNYGIKFSGRRGFHICLPFEMFPKDMDYTPTAKNYPKVPRILARFIRSKISKELMRGLLKKKSAKELVDILGEPPGRLDPFYFVEVEKDWGARHMFRAPYSLNEKTWLVSLPISYSELKNFSDESAKPENVKVGTEFFKGEENEAESLLLDAMDWYAARKKISAKRKEPVKKTVWEKKISEEYFPPCIKLIMAGLSDGKKRSVFTLVNFLRVMNWSWEEIEEKLMEWNEKNRPAIPRNLLVGQFRWNQAQQRSINPANCYNDTFYVSIGVCKPDETCRKIKNPVSYPFRRMFPAFKKQKKARGFSCDVCNKEFPTMRSLQMHKGRSH